MSTEVSLSSADPAPKAGGSKPSNPRGSRSLKLPLLAQLVVALVLMGLLPFGISFFQLQKQARVVETQAKDRHHLATRTAGQRLETFVGTFAGVAIGAAQHPAVEAGVRNQELGNALTGTVSAVPGVLAVGLFTSTGEAVALAQRRNLTPEIGPVFGAPSAPRLQVLTSDTGNRFLRIREPLQEGKGFLILIAEADVLDRLLDIPELGESFKMLLIDGERQVLAGGSQEELSTIPDEVLAEELAKVGSWSRIFRDHLISGRKADVVAGRVTLDNAPWVVVSRQNAAEAEQAKTDMARARWSALALALLLTSLFSAGAYFTVIQPLRRLIAAQAAITGQEADGGGSEIAQLEASFRLLQQRIQDEEELGDIFLGRYQVTDLVGSGAMGSVFRGWDPKLQRAVALKTIHLNTEEVDQEKLIGSLREEAAISARIHQPNIVTVYDIEDRGSTAFIAMEYVEGVNLQTLLRKRTRLPYTDVIPIGAALARGLAAAHSNYLVHHDVKPANLLLGFDGSVKLTDFGVSLSLTAASQKSDVICGTPGYLAPECFEGQGYSPGSDIWALGVVLWEAVAGYNPFRGGNLRATVGRTMTIHPEPLKDLYSEIPDEFSDLVQQLLVKDPSERPTDGLEVAEQLEGICRRLELQWIPDLADVMPSESKKKSKADAPTVWVPKKAS